MAFFGLLMMSFSIIMIMTPKRWANGIVRFSEKIYFHLFEIISRLAFGGVFIMYGQQTLYPIVMPSIGYLLVAVGVGLALTPPSKHKQFAVWSAHQFKNTFQLAGIVSLCFGIFIVYAALATA